MLYLASQSPRRRQLLEQIGIDFAVVEVDVPEQRGPNESPEEYVSRVAHAKALAGFARMRDVAGAVVLGVDTEVVLDDQVFGKPTDAESAAAMLRQLSGRTHVVISVVWGISADRERSARCVSEVRFSTLNEAAIATYVATGEPFGKAGAYAIQGRAAAFIEHLQGSYSGVMGLPVCETAQLLRSFSVLPS